MKISYNWLKNYAGFNLTPTDLAEILTNTGLEVEEVTAYESVKGGLEGVVIGEIVGSEPHPDADKLKVTQVNVGKPELLQIVCGAPNCRVGLKSPVALVGATLYPFSGDKIVIKKAKIRGVESFGMICADDELGLGASHAGIMELPESVAAGTPAADYFKVEKDYLLEIGLTPNRSDAFSHIGVARDLVAALQAVYKIDLPLSKPNAAIKVLNNKVPFPIVVTDAAGCKRYSAVLVKNVKVADSPQWLKNKLQVIGLKPINNVVDVTNFVLHEYGQPLHAFDAARISDKLEVRRANPGERFKTLDGNELELHEEDVLIADSKGGLCLAGVYGGLNSGITAASTTVLLESANFDALMIRKTAARHDLRTDAAIHFEKGCDINITVTALQRAAALLCEIAGGEVASAIEDSYPNPVKGFPVTISIARIRSLAGVEISLQLIKAILNKLEIEVVAEIGDQWELLVPTFKTEVTREADIAEEILRIMGYSSIPIPKKLHASLSFSNPVDAVSLQETASNWLVGAGFNEVSTNSVAQAKWEMDADLQAQQVRLLNSQTTELDSLRTSMLYSLLEVVAHNQNRRMSDLKLFEFGSTYLKQNEKYIQQSHLVLLLSGKLTQDNWLEKGKAYDFFHLKAYANQLLERFGIAATGSVVEEKMPFDYQLKLTVENEVVATLGKVNDAVLKQFDIKQPVFFADMNWGLITQRSAFNQVRFEQLPKFPSVRRDLALVVDAALSFEKVEAAVRMENKKLLREVDLFDVYKGEKLGADKKSYAVSFVFSDPEKTLTDAEIDKAMNKVIKRLEADLGAAIRK
ncbi:MAG: phenylalanine--tRNA ligase subunit beta [Chitinophagales bacterium]